MYFMEKEIRMAGCDPTGKAGAAISTASVNTISFAEDGDGDGAVTNITYSLSGSDLVRNGARIAENIDALNFVYLDGGFPPTVLNPGKTDVPAANTPNIRSVEVTIVARTGKENPHYTDSKDYKNKQDETIFTPSGDDVHFRRKLLSTSIKCRNLGL
jgi:hypothetical protein